MDEQTSQKIVIKINGKKSEIEEKNLVEKEKENIKISSWDEKVKAEKELAASNEQRNGEQEFPWVLPDDPKVVIPIKKDKKKIMKIKNYPSSNIISLYKKIFLTIILAIIIGIGFGMFAIHLLSKDSSVPAQSKLQDETKIVEKTSSNESVNSNQTTSFSIPLYVIQNGKFTNKNGAETSVLTIRERGLPAEIFEVDGAYYVFIGVANNQSDAETLKQLLEEKQIETYDKPIEVKLSSQNPQDSKEIIEKLVKVSSAFINNPSSIDQKDINDLKNRNLTNENASLKSAIEQLGKSSITQKQLWEVQQIILKYLALDGKIQ